MSYLAALSYVAQAAAALLVGWISDRWTSAGKPEPSIRRGILVLGQLLLGIAIVGILISRAEPFLWLWLSVAGAGIGSGTVNLYAVAQIFAGQRASGTWVGVQNAIGNLAGIVGPVVTGVFIDLTGSYSDGFWLAAAVAGAGALWWWLVLPPIRQLELE